MGREDFKIDDDLIAQLNAASDAVREADSRSIEDELYSRNEMMGDRDRRTRRERPRIEESPDEFDAFSEEPERRPNLDSPHSRRPRVVEEDAPVRSRDREESPRRSRDLENRPRSRQNSEDMYSGVLDRDEIRSQDLSNGNLSSRDEFFNSPNEYDEDSEKEQGPLNIDRPNEPRRRPMMEEDDEEFTPKKRKKSDGSSFLSKFNIKPKYVAIIVGIAVFFIVGSILEKNKGNNQLLEDTTYAEETVSSDVEETNDSSDNSEESNDANSSGNTTTNSGSSTVERGELYNDTQISFSKDVYDDEIAVSKFLEYRGASCIPKFMGYSEVLEREIEFQVSPSDYNKYLNGVKISITYRAVEKDGITYVTDIKIKQ